VASGAVDGRFGWKGDCPVSGGVMG